MTQFVDPMFIGVVRTSTVKFINADGTTQKTLLTLSAQTKITRLVVTSTDTTARFITMLLGDGSKLVYEDCFRIPAANSGRPVQRINILDPGRWSDLNYDDPSIDRGTGMTVVFRMETAVTSGAFETAVICDYGDLAAI